MNELLDRAVVLEAEFNELADAKELDDALIAHALKRRDFVHREMGRQVDENPELLSVYQPFLQEAYDNTQKLQQRCEQERDDVQKKLITLNTSKKARKVY